MAARLRRRSFSRRYVLRKTCQGDGRWPASVQGTRHGSQAGRTALLLGGDLGPRGSVVEGGNPPGQAGRRETTGGSARGGVAAIARAYEDLDALRSETSVGE